MTRDPLAQLYEQYPTPAHTAQGLEEELQAFSAVMRLAAPHWHTPLPGRAWSPAQEAEHVVLVNESAGRLVGLLLSDRPLRALPQVPGRTENGRRLAPPGTEPGSGEALETLLDRHARSSALLAEFRPEPDPARTFVHPFLGPLDALDWLRMAAWHMGHHRRAMERGLAGLGGVSTVADVFVEPGIDKLPS